ncbi:major facilitator superfamily domain-containing protein [Aspergillus flavus]|uniref:Major facilitator superfamily domain-containing protein n=2 Tax=Aspergillus subgen. Circumdati TaxID=2720871 RepID=A0A5N6GZL3_ASPFL|nr:synaptic vesicle transporter SVOP [Aspergillus oryzae 3.042]KAB8246689.1 major facilitator superfamily domain-containing protein [Aspergillus flavus]KDE81504.1 synaptic vesicle transporter SVOP [Aspergillus oryzae 100-8]|eukprot:EIT80122.1 synaptic vesicle transporter SVOP [Aspergillus oryzae 3.042]
MTASMEMQRPRQNDDVQDATQPGKVDVDFVESTAGAIPTSYSDIVESRISKAHRDYLLERHGTLELDPIPSMDPADPYNWPSWKKLANLVLVAIHACMGTFAAAGIIPAYATIAEEYNVTVQKASYLTSLQIAILGGAPLFWKPMSNRYGRRPIFLISLMCSLVCNVGCAKSTDYASTAACRALQAFFISPASAIGSAVVMETYFKRDRAKYMGVWTLLVTLGIPLGPFIFGFVAYRAGYVWIYWVLAIVNGVQFVLYLFLGPETRYVGSNVNPNQAAWKREYLSLRRIDPTPFSWWEFVKPLTMVMYPSVMIPAAAYAMVFLLSNVLATVEVPELLQEKFELNTEQLGMQFLGPIIGSVIGEQLGGRLSDLWMNTRAKKIQRKPEPEHRLWLSYIGFICSIVGLIVFLVCTQESASGHWNVAPIIGIAIGAAGNQIVTTVLITYAVDCYPTEAASVGVCITFVRQIWGFLGPFWFPPMFESVGVAASAGVGCALLVGVSVIPTLCLHFMGRRWRPDINA